MKITIENYQRIEEVEIELKTGLNLITGSSNNGKSSSLRAVRDFIFNKFSNDKIRHGEKETTVSLDCITAHRTKEGTKYNVNGELFEKVGRNQLKEVYETFEIGEVVVNGITIRPNFWLQFEKPFIFDKTPGQKNDLIIGSKNDKYLKALKSIKSNQAYLSKTEKKSLQDSINLLKKQNLDMTTEIEKLAGVEELYNKIAIFGEEEENLKKTETLLKETLNLDANIKAINKKLDFIENILEKYKQPLEDKFKEIQEYQNLDDILYKLKNSESEVCLLKSNLINIEKYISEGESLEKELISFEDDVTTYKEIVTIAKEVFKTRDYIKGLIKKGNEDIEARKILEKEFIDYKKEVEMCPLCERRFDDNSREI